jgi:transposase InsO family protein
VIVDRDEKLRPAFRAMFRDSGIEPVRLPDRSANLNAHVERSVRSMREECIDRMIFFGSRSLRRALAEHLAHYHGERPHQGLGNELIEPRLDAGRTSGAVRCVLRLGGMLKYYYRETA